MSHKLPTINAEELLSCPMPPTRFIIDHLLPQGLYPRRCDEDRQVLAGTGSVSLCGQG